jgi:hypothetical protein
VAGTGNSRNEGVVVSTSSPIKLSGAEWERYGKGNVIVQARVRGYREPAGGRIPLYNFIEDLGGVTKLFPVGIVLEQRTLPIKFEVPNVSNSKLHVTVQIDTYVPPGIPNLPGVNVKLDAISFTVDPGMSKQVAGVLTKPGAGDCGRWPSICCQFTKKDGVALGTGLALVGLIGFGASRRRGR